MSVYADAHYITVGSSLPQHPLAGYYVCMKDPETSARKKALQNHTNITGDHTDSAVKYSAYVMGLTPDSVPDNANIPESIADPTKSNLSRPDVLSDSDEEMPSEDPFLFRQMGKKVKEKLKKLSASIFDKKDESTPVLEARVVPPEFIPNDVAVAIRSAVDLPFLEIALEKDGYCKVPLILGLVKV